MTKNSEIDIKKEIFVKNAHLNNLKHIDVLLPKNKLIVITGVSGSGKSSLAFDTIYAEGQRRYVESLSSYARQFLGKLEKPKVDDIKGLAPSIAIQQKVISSNPRSTVGTSTEVYDYLKLLFARIGRTFSPISGREVKKDSVSDVIDFIKKNENQTFLLRNPLNFDLSKFNEQLKTLKLSGFTRIEVNGNVAGIEDLESFGFVPEKDMEIQLVIDRFRYEEDENFLQRLAAKDQYEETQASIVSLGIDKNYEKWGLNSAVYWRRGQDMYEYIRNKPEIYRNMHIGNNLGAEINGNYRSDLGTTGLGLELRKEFLASNNLGHRERLVNQVFFEHHFSFFQNTLNVSPGISWANYDKEGNFFYPGLDVGFDFNENHKIYGNIAKVNRIPTFTDLYYLSKTEAGNPDLKPENAISAEVGYRFQKHNFLGKISGFSRDSDNSIDWSKQNANDIWRAENIGKIHTKGVEVEFGQHFNSFLKSYSVGYTFLESNYKQPSGLMSRYVMENLKHQFVAKLEVFFLKKFTNQLIYRYNERVSTGSYQILDEKLSYDAKNYNIYIMVNNILDTEYTETFGVPMPGRWFHIGVSFKTGF